MRRTRIQQPLRLVPVKPIDLEPEKLKILSGVRVVEFFAVRPCLRACRDAGIGNLTFHDLRHTWSTRAAECGVPESVRRDVLGHSATTMTGFYTHSSPQAMELVADYSREKTFSLTAKSRQAV